MQIIFSLVFSLIFGFLSAYVAAKKKRRASLWFFIGLFAGLLGFLVLLILPPPKEPAKDDFLSDLILKKTKKPEILPKPSSPYEQYRWYYVDLDRKAQGPLSFSSLKELYAQEVISKETLLWHEGAPAWQTLLAYGGLELDLTEEE